MRSVGVTVSLATVLVALLYLSSCAESINIGNYLRETKDRLVNAMRDGIIGSSASMMAFNETMHKIQVRYDEAVARGELEGKDQPEQSSFYYKIVIEEIKALKKSLQPEESSFVDEKIEELARGCKECTDEARAKLSQELVMDEDVEEELEGELENELDDTEKMERVLQLEAEMGWSIDPETRQALKMRTLNLLSELVQNEVKTLVVIIIKAYFVGSTPATAVPAVIGAVNSGLKSKVGEYLTNTIMDIFTNFFKKQAVEAVAA